MNPPDEKSLTSEIQVAMKSGDKLRVSVLRLLLASMKNARVSKMDELTPDEILGVIQKEVRKREESAGEFRKGGREDRALAEEAEADILKVWLPEPLSSAELDDLVAATIAELGADSPGDMGKVMRAVMERVGGRAEGKQVSELVRAKLSV